MSHTAFIMPEKKDLKTPVIKGHNVTWDCIRKAFLRVNFSSFHDDRLCYLIYEEAFKAAGYSYRKVMNQLSIPCYTDSFVECIYLDYLDVREALELEGLIEILFENTYVLSQKAHTLKCQPTTPPLTRAEAELLLKNTIEKVSILNDDKESPYIIDKLYVFGSYLSDNKVLGDLDISYDLVVRMDECETIPEWRLKERNYLKKHNRAKVSTLIKKLIGSKKVSLDAFSNISEDECINYKCIYQSSLYKKAQLTN